MEDLILKVFEGSLPCGEDCKYEDSFLLIEQEIDKNNSVTQEGSTDWKIVVRDCEDFLINESKDLKIASWMLYGLWKNKSWKGLKKGIYIYNKLLEKFNNEIYPKSKKAKNNLFMWIEENLTNDILLNESIKNTTEDEVEFLELFQKLNSNINISLETKNNNFRKIIHFFTDLVNKKNTSIEQEESIKILEKKILEKKEENNDKIYVKKQEEITKIENDQDAIKVLRNFKKSASLLTEFYRKQNISNLKALRITRLLSWLETEGLPNAEGKKTFLQPPSELELDQLESLYKNKEYEDALYLVEEIIEVSPFWIDGHYYSYNILEKTKNFEEANELKNILASFLKTNDGILNLTFIDDKPFASNRTKKWIQEELFTLETTESDTKKTEDKEESTHLKSEVYDLANENKLKDAMILLANKIENACNIEEKFKLRLLHAQLAIEFDKKEIALALLEGLEKDIEKYHLLEWNPKLASQVFTLLLTSFSNVDIHIDKLGLLYKNLCNTDINSAFEIKIN